MKRITTILLYQVGNEQNRILLISCDQASAWTPVSACVFWRFFNEFRTNSSYHQTIRGVQVLAFALCHLSIESRSTEVRLVTVLQRGLIELLEKRLLI